MATIADYLLELDRQRDQLAANLTAMGVLSTAEEKLNTLVPKGTANSYRRRRDDENGTIRCK